jgi:membrane protease YdiL (CAAX protease family)
MLADLRIIRHRNPHPVVNGMKHLYSARNVLEAHGLRMFLAVQDIDANVTGDNNAFEAGFSFTPQSAPCVFVDEADFERASGLLTQFADRPGSLELQGAWTCPNCQQGVGSQFDVCWKCGTPRGDTPIEEPRSLPIDANEDESSHDEATPFEVVAPAVASSTRRTWVVWFEVFTVLALTKPLYGGRSLIGFVFALLGFHNAATNFYLPAILYDAFAVVVTLAAMRLSGDPWSAFGIKKPAALDILTGSIVCIINYFATMMGVSIFIDILKSMCSERYIYQITHAHDIPFHVQGWTGLVLLLVLAFVVGFSEELVLRSYLIPRLERLLHSTWASVLVSAAVFGLLHWKSGILNVCHAFLAGIVYGVAFAWTRRIWPVAVAHAAYDFSAFLSHAG